MLRLPVKRRLHCGDDEDEALDIILNSRGGRFSTVKPVEEFVEQMLMRVIRNRRGPVNLGFAADAVESHLVSACDFNGTLLKLGAIILLIPAVDDAGGGTIPLITRVDTVVHSHNVEPAGVVLKTRPGRIPPEPDERFTVPTGEEP